MKTCDLKVEIIPTSLSQARRELTKDCKLFAFNRGKFIQQELYALPESTKLVRANSV